MIYDCFPFFQELDLLEIRLNTLQSVVDKFVICEMSTTHSGKPKPYILEENLDRFDDFNIDYYQIGTISGTSWELENWHRRSLKPENFTTGDVIILSDLDEIPNPELIKAKKLGRYIQRMYYFHLNTYAQQEWPSGTIVIPGVLARTRDWQELRMDKTIPRVENGGWHFSSVGTIEDVLTKMESFAHTEYDNLEARGEVLLQYSTLQSIHNEVLIVDPMEKLPKYIQDNYDKFKDLLWTSVST